MSMSSVDLEDGKFSDQGVDDVEGEARIDEDICPARTGLQGPCRAGVLCKWMLVADGA